MNKPNQELTGMPWVIQWIGNQFVKVSQNNLPASVLTDNAESNHASRDHSPSANDSIGGEARESTTVKPADLSEQDSRGRQSLNKDKIVKLPIGWRDKFWPESRGKRPEWIDQITHGKIKGRVITSDLQDTGQYWVALIKQDGGWTSHDIFVDEWDLSLAQVEEK